MFSTDDFLATVELETRICKHLNDKLKGDQLTYRPAEGMRSTLELLQYLTYCGIAPARALVDGDWSGVAERATRAKGITAASFGDHMDAQLAELRLLIGDLTPAQLDAPASLPWGEQSRLGKALVDTSLRFLTAYRMQLFLYAKASGSSELSTINCWAGADAPPAG